MIGPCVCSVRRERAKATHARGCSICEWLSRVAGTVMVAAVLGAMTLLNDTGVLGEVKASLIRADSARTLAQWLDVTKATSQGKVDEAKRMCGVYCLGVVLRLFDLDHSIQEIRRHCEITAKGVSMGSMLRAAASMGLPMKVVRCDPGVVWRLPLPAIAQTRLTSGKKLSHYVVLLSATPDSVKGVDSSIGVFFDAKVSELRRNLTGCLLIADRSQHNARELALLWLTGGVVGFAVVLLFRWAARRRRVRHHLPISSTGAIIVAVATLGFPGCSGRAPPAEQIRIARPVVDLGFLEPDFPEVSREFTVENVHNEPVELTLGPSSCGCVGAAFKSGPRLDTNCRGEVVLTISGHGRHAGPMSVSTLVGVKGSPEIHAITLKGIVEGLASASEPYVIRPRRTSSSAGYPPDLQLNLVTQDSNTAFRLMDITSTTGELIFGTEKRVVSGAMRLPGFFGRHIVVPVKLNLGRNQYTTCQIVVRYRLKGHGRELRISALVLVPNGDARTAAPS